MAKPLVNPSLSVFLHSSSHSINSMNWKCRRNNFNLLLIIIFMMEIIYCGVVESSSSEMLGQWKCKSSSASLIGKLGSKYEIFKNPKMPSVECERVILPDNTVPLPVEEFWHVEDYPTIAFPEISDLSLLDVCQSFKIVEERNNLTCIDLCENYAYNRSEIFDFINYCKYCSNAKGYKSFNERIENNNCKNSNATIRSMLEDFPRDARFCGHSNFGVPFISPYLDYSYLCYCVNSNMFGMGCKKRALTEFIIDFTAYTGIISFSALSLFILFSSLIPKLINLLQKDRDRNQYSLMKLLPSLAIFLASVLRVLSLVFELLNLISAFRYLATISEFVNYFALIPILVNLYGLMKYVKTQKKPNSILSYCLTFSIFIILITCCVLISAIFQFTVGPLYMVIGWISVSWAIEFLIHAACFVFLLIIYFTLKKISDVSAFSTKVSFHFLHFYDFYCMLN
ncbi:predicted protein [Naegleria gruberi]|uniref:Predicted protein n=1 Tax=Naegleria gruberi TaxID=5762 RepID=D2V400_NAEGR|nr:uncharacterized protein NAEGRDRAFT_63548 [Naegleria gruberi]EFC48437.1 predicted protein [Naegleria gruberi]|eukprot:XP_002681181.1 predicted protein [Naegleria gruberi strain NEG-M]